MEFTIENIASIKDEIKEYLKKIWPSTGQFDDMQEKRREYFKSIGINFPECGIIEINPNVISDIEKRKHFVDFQGYNGYLRDYFPHVNKDVNNDVFNDNMVSIFSDKSKVRKLAQRYPSFNFAHITERINNRKLVLSIRWDDMVLGSDYCSWKSCISIRNQHSPGGGRIWAQSQNSMMLSWIADDQADVDEDVGTGDATPTSRRNAGIISYPIGYKMTGRRFGLADGGQYHFSREYGILKIGLFGAMDMLNNHLTPSPIVRINLNGNKLVKYKYFIDEKYSGNDPIIMNLTLLNYVPKGSVLRYDSEPSDFIACQSCDEGFLRENLFDITFIDDNNMRRDIRICKKCSEENYFLCNNCGLVHPIKNHIIISGAKYCNNCVPIISKECADCKTIHNRKQMVSVNGKRMVCEECSKKYKSCKSCGKHFSEKMVVTRGKHTYCKKHDPVLSCHKCDSANIELLESNGVFIGYCPDHKIMVSSNGNIVDINDYLSIFGIIFCTDAKGSWYHFASGEQLSSDSTDIRATLINKARERKDKFSAKLTDDNALRSFVELIDSKLPLINKIVEVGDLLGNEDVL